MGAVCSMPLRAFGNRASRAQQTHIGLAPINSRRGGKMSKPHLNRRERPALNLETAILLWLFCAAIAAAIAHTKNRNVGEGFLWGALLGVIGVIIVLCLPPPKSKTLLPPGTPPPPGAAKGGWYPDPAGTGQQRYWNGKKWSDLPPRDVSAQ
jgi:Protein of unknown function (DUF2510)